MSPFYTIGHSTRPVEEFVELLRGVGADVVADVRAFPRSRTNPHYDRERLPGHLAPVGITYVHLPDLGGRRGRESGAEPSANGFWENAAFRNYADYALTDGFRAALERLLALGARHTPAIMCAEAVWWRCHRRIITDYLLHAGADVRHVLSRARVDQARPTAAARARGDGRLVYPPMDTAAIPATARRVRSER